MLWNRRSRSCIERTGDDVWGERRRGRVVAGASGEALESGSVVIGTGGVEARDRRGLDGVMVMLGKGETQRRRIRDGQEKLGEERRAMAG